MDNNIVQPGRIRICALLDCTDPRAVSVRMNDSYQNGIAMYALLMLLTIDECLRECLLTPEISLRLVFGSRVVDYDGLDYLRFGGAGYERFRKIAEIYNNENEESSFMKELFKAVLQQSGSRRDGDCDVLFAVSQNRLKTGKESLPDGVGMPQLSFIYLLDTYADPTAEKSRSDTMVVHRLDQLRTLSEEEDRVFELHDCSEPICCGGSAAVDAREQAENSGRALAEIIIGHTADQP